VEARLRNGDPVRRAVELAVATAVESMSLVLAARFERCDAGEAGE
jgi:hypothetical protein